MDRIRPGHSHGGDTANKHFPLPCSLRRVGHACRLFVVHGWYQRKNPTSFSGPCPRRHDLYLHSLYTCAVHRSRHGRIWNRNSMAVSSVLRSMLTYPSGCLGALSDRNLGVGFDCRLGLLQKRDIDRYLSSSMEEEQEERRNDSIVFNRSEPTAVGRNSSCDGLHTLSSFSRPRG